MGRHGTAAWHALAVTSCCALLSACNRTTFLDPAGPVARADRNQLLLTLAIMLFVMVPIFVVLPYFAWRYRRSNARSTYKPDWEFSRPLEMFVWGGPILIVAVLATGLWIHTHELDPYRPVASKQPPIEVQVVALDWKWLFLYPEQGVAAADRMVIPEGRAVHLSLTSDTVMQSFLVPQLAGQIYAMAGMRTQLNLLADRSGQFTGMNTQYNGTGFSRQRFIVHAVPPRAFDDWVRRARAQAGPLDDAAYRRLSQRTVLARPIVFGGVRPGLFDEILNRYAGAMAPMPADAAAP